MSYVPKQWYYENESGTAEKREVVSQIGVTVDHGVVTLSGRVNNYTQKISADQAEKRIKSWL